MTRLRQTARVGVALAAALLVLLATTASASPSSSDALRLAELDAELSAPLSLMELQAIDHREVINEHVRPEDRDEAHALTEGDAFLALTEDQQRAEVDASLAEVDAAVAEDRSVNHEASSLLQTHEGSAKNYWDSAWNRRHWCNRVRWGYWHIEKNAHWQNICKGIERFRPWGWWSHFCHNIHHGAWGRWYRHNHWWKRHCNSIRNPHFVGSAKPWLWHPGHRRHANTKWCEKNGHHHRDLNNAFYNHWCHGREAPKGYRRGLWDVDPKASAKQQDNFWFCKAYRGYDNSWKLNNKSVYQARCTRGEGARGAKHPGYDPKLTPAQRRAIRQKAKAAAARAKARAARPQWRWSKKVPRTADSKWCEKHGLDQASSARFQKACEGNREGDKERARRIKRAAIKAKKRVLAQIPHKHHRKHARRLSKSQRAAKKAARKAKKAARKAKKRAARKAKRAARKAARKARWAKLEEDELAAAKARHAKAKARRRARRAARKARRKAKRAARRARRAALKARRRAKIAKCRQAGRRHCRRRFSRRRRGGCSKRKFRKLRRRHGRRFARKWRKACRARRRARRAARRSGRVGRRRRHRKLRQIKIRPMVKNPLVLKAKAARALKKLSRKLSPKKKAKIARKLKKLKRALKKNLPKGVKPKQMSDLLKALKLAQVVQAKGGKKGKKGKKVPMPPAPKLPPRPKTAPKLKVLKKVASKLALATAKPPAPRVKEVRPLSPAEAKKEAIKAAPKAVLKAVARVAAKKAAAKVAAKAAAAAPPAPTSSSSSSSAPAPVEREVRSSRDQWQRDDAPKGFQMHIPDLSVMDAKEDPNSKAAPVAAKPAAVPAAKPKPTIEEIWAKEDAARRLARQKRLDKEDAEDKAEERARRRRIRLAHLRAKKAAEAAKKPGARRGAPGENKDWDAKYPSAGKYTPPAKKFVPKYAQAGDAGCPGCKNRFIRKKWDIVLDPTSVSEIDLPLIQELHRRVDYLIEPAAKTMDLKESLLRSAAQQVVDAEEHHIRVYDFGEKHKDQLLIPQYIQDEQEIVDLADH